VLFTSPLFIYIFLPVTLALNLLAPRFMKNFILLAASIFFYAWGEVFYSVVFVFSMGMNYCLGLLVDHFRQHKSGIWIIGLAVAANLLLLAGFKYANFITDNLNAALWLMQITAINIDPVHLPIGISFFTFHAISYLMDIWRGVSRVQKNPLDLALYLALFPQLIAGPIIRYHDIADQLESRQSTLDNLYFGARRFIFGLAKKLVIANTFGIVADGIFSLPSGELTAPLAWLGIFSYTMQLYFDFSAYSCMAIGLGRMFGFRFLENFNYPYVAKSIQEFWRRWHISLSRWFRDYLYIPLGGNRLGEKRTYINLLVVFFLCGLWHGASWNFVVWGLFHGVFLVLERAGLDGFLLRLPRFLAHVYTLLIVMIGWVFFRSDSLGYAVDYLQAMAGFGATSTISDNAGFYLNREFLVVSVFAVIFSTPVWLNLEKWLEEADCKTNNALSSVGRHLLQTSTAIYVLGLGFLCLLYINAGTYNPFIYFRF
jgi:alginate O-acetyltransferase complex protein AlgI